MATPPFGGAPASAPAPDIDLSDAAAPMGGDDAQAGSVQITLTPNDVTQLKGFFDFLKMILDKVAPEDDDDSSAPAPGAAAAAMPAKNPLAGLGAELDAERR